MGASVETLTGTFLNLLRGGVGYLGYAHRVTTCDRE